MNLLSSVLSIASQDTIIFPIKICKRETVLAQVSFFFFLSCFIQPYEVDHCKTAQYYCSIDYYYSISSIKLIGVSHHQLHLHSYRSESNPSSH